MYRGPEKLSPPDQPEPYPEEEIDVSWVAEAEASRLRARDPWPAEPAEEIDVSWLDQAEADYRRASLPWADRQAEASRRAGASWADRQGDEAFKRRMQRRFRFELAVLRREDQFGVGEARWSGSGPGLPPDELERLWREAAGH